MRKLWCLVLLMSLVLITGFSVRGEDRLPVPSGKSYERTKAEMRQLYADLLKKNEDQASRTALSQDIFDVARATTDDAAAAYALYELALELAVDTGDPTLFISILEVMQERYQVSQFTELRKHLKALVKNAPRNSEGLSELYLMQIDGAIKADDFPYAQQMLTRALSEARKQKDKALTKQLVEKRKNIGQMQREFRELTVALGTLEKTPDDPKANEAVGRYYALIKGDWDAGLPLLAKADDEKIAGLAQTDLLQPSDAIHQLKLADLWWIHAGQEKGIAEYHVFGRAYHWYTKALPGLEGLAKKKAEVRIAALEEKYAVEGEGKYPKPIDAVITITCDNIFSLWVNGKAVAEKVGDWGKHETYELKLKSGDIITIHGIDQGPGNKTAGLYCSIKMGEDQLPSGKDWFYILEPNAKWLKSRSVKGGKPVSLENIHPTHANPRFPNASGKFFWTAEAKSEGYFKFIVP